MTLLQKIARKKATEVECYGSGRAVERHTCNYRERIGQCAYCGQTVSLIPGCNAEEHTVRI